jgi:hypothetical protein
MRHRLAFLVIVAYLWVLMILLGAILLETFMVYPNIFHDPPRSLELGLEFMSGRAPSDFFPPLGFLSWVTGAGALVLSWRVKSARWWILFSLPAGAFLKPIHRVAAKRSSRKLDVGFVSEGT